MWIKQNRGINFTARANLFRSPNRNQPEFWKFRDALGRDWREYDYNIGNFGGISYVVEFFTNQTHAVGNFIEHLARGGSHRASENRSTVQTLSIE